VDLAAPWSPPLGHALLLCALAPLLRGHTHGCDVPPSADDSFPSVLCSWEGEKGNRNEYGVLIAKSVTRMNSIFVPRVKLRKDQGPFRKGVALLAVWAAGATGMRLLGHWPRLGRRPGALPRPARRGPRDGPSATPPLGSAWCRLRLGRIGAEWAAMVLGQFVDAGPFRIVEQFLS